MSLRRIDSLALAATLVSSLVLAQEETPSELPTADTLIESVQTAWNPLQIRLVANMTIRQPGRPEFGSQLLIRRAGFGRTRIDFLSPEKDRGKVMLQIGDETWLYIPRIGRAIEVPAKRSPLAGGVLFEDLFPGHEAEPGAAEVEAGEDSFILVTHASKGKKKTKGGTSRIFFDRSSLLPVRREVYSSSGRLLKTVQIDEMREWEGVPIPWRIHFVDHLRKGAEIRLEVVRATNLTAEEEQLIAHDRLSDGPAINVLDPP